MKFLGVLLDESISWQSHIQLFEDKISKNIGILYKAKFLLNQKCLKDIYYQLYSVYINYANIVWSSTNHTKLTTLFSKQKQASRIIFNEDKQTAARPLMKKLNALNVYQINIYQTLLFMHKIKYNLAAKIFNDHFEQMNHKYSTKFSENSFKQPKTILKSTGYSVLNRAPSLWNKSLDTKWKSIHSLSLFRQKVKEVLLNNSNEQEYF